jgi:hypothetical protein
MNVANESRCWHRILAAGLYRKQISCRKYLNHVDSLVTCILQRTAKTGLSWPICLCVLHGTFVQSFLSGKQVDKKKFGPAEYHNLTNSLT